MDRTTNAIAALGLRWLGFLQRSPVLCDTPPRSARARCAQGVSTAVDVVVPWIQAPWPGGQFALCRTSNCATWLEVINCPMKVNKMTCRLCGSAETLRHSHIFPDFFIRSLQDNVVTGESGQTQPVSILLSTHPEIKGGQRQRGHWEKRAGMKEYLLCSNCEEKFSTYELYFREFFYEKLPGRLKKAVVGNPIPVPVPIYGPIFDRWELKGVRQVRVNYLKLKMFVLSLMWRASIAQGPFFQEFDLGRHQDLVADMLRKENPGSDTAYGLQMFDLRLENWNCEDLIKQPTIDKEDGCLNCSVVMGGFLFLVCIADGIRGLPEAIIPFRLLESGSLIIPSMDATPVVGHWVETLRAAGQWQRPE